MINIINKSGINFKSTAVIIGISFVIQVNMLFFSHSLII